MPGGGGRFQILIDEEISGARHFSLLLNEIQPGYVGAYHEHEVEHGWYVLQGRGTIWIGETPYPVGPDMAVFAPAGVPHKVASEGPGAAPVRGGVRAGGSRAGIASEWRDGVFALGESPEID